MNKELKLNFYGVYTLLIREIRRFLKVYHQTIIAPVISALIFLSIFLLALGDIKKTVNDIPYIEFAGYGLIIMTIIQNSFANSASTLIMARVLGYVNDILMTPFNGIELVISYTLGSLARGIIVGLTLSFFLSFLIDFRCYNIFIVISYVIIACVLMSNLGTLSALLTDNFDQNSAISSYIITPLSFLSGTFYSINELPTWAKSLNYINPFFYIIDGFRFGLTGAGDSTIAIGLPYLIILDIAIIILTIKIIDSGWKLKS
jgi:ABC-2 type transport system permease protein